MNQIVERLCGLGLSNEVARDVFRVTQKGIQNGVNASVTKGLSSTDYTRGASELYDAAFDEGFNSFKRQFRLALSRRLLIPMGILAAIILILFLLRLR